MSDSRLPSMFSGLNPWSLVRAMFAPSDWLSASESASDLVRFFRSKHVIDLKVIAVLALLVATLTVMGWHWGWHDFNVSTVAGVLGVCLAVIGWAYRSASTRLGVVDLFACEISTLCRVGTIFDTAKHYTALYDIGKASEHPTSVQRPEASRKFVSQEEYFPVLASNARDLQLLQAEVVSHIIEFYTYIKALRDQLRGLGELDPTAAADTDGGQPDKWHSMVFNILYSLFLGYESARKAIRDLVEFEPAAAERTIAILLTELRCYTFLVTRMSIGDFRYARLSLRELDYENEVIPLCDRVESHSQGKHEKDWRPASRTVAELKRRYRDEYKPAIEKARVTQTLTSTVVP